MSGEARCSTLAGSAARTSSPAQAMASANTRARGDSRDHLPVALDFEPHDLVRELRLRFMQTPGRPASLAKRSAQRQHDELSVRSSQRQQVEPPLNVGHGWPLYRQRHPAPRTTAKRDVTHRKATSSKILVGRKVGIYDA